MKAASYLSFDLPKGFQTPEGLQDDSEFETLATVKLSKGKAQLVALDGKPLSTDGNKEEIKEAKVDGPSDDRPGFTDVVMGAMRGGGQKGGGY